MNFVFIHNKKNVLFYKEITDKQHYLQQTIKNDPNQTIKRNLN